MIDALSGNTLDGSRNVPSDSPGNFLVTPVATGEWAGHEGKIASGAPEAWTYSDPVVDWLTTFSLLPKVMNTSWQANFANWYADRIQNLMPDTKLDVTAGFTFTFGKSAFQTALASVSSIADFANAWETGLLASAVTVSTGAFVDEKSNLTLFSAVATAILDLPSIALGKAKILELVGVSPIGDALDSKFPVKFRQATLLLTMTVSGSDSSPTPVPLVAATVPLV